MTIAWIIGLILSFILFNLSSCLYYDYDGDRNNKVFKKEYKLKRPLWLVVLFLILSLVPILNITLPIVLFALIGVCISERDIFFHSENKIINFLNKSILKRKLSTGCACNIVGVAKGFDSPLITN